MTWFGQKWVNVLNVVLAFNVDNNDNDRMTLFGFAFVCWNC